MTDGQTVSDKDGYTAMVEVAATVMKTTFMVPVEMMKFGFGMQMKMFSMMESMMPGAGSGRKGGGGDPSPSPPQPSPSPAPAKPAAGWGPVIQQTSAAGWGPMPPHEAS